MRRSCSIKIERYRKNGFSMAEALVTLLLVGVLSAAAVPMMSQMAQMKTGNDKNTMQCIDANSSNAWYNATTGDTSAIAEGTVCYLSVQDATFNRGYALSSALWYADRGTATQKTMAKKILRASCDLGGEKACDYFISTCRKSGSATAPYCDDTTSFLDITYYLHKDYGTTTNSGVRYIKSELENPLEKMVTNLVNEVSYACTFNQAPDNGQNLNTNTSCDLASPEYLIDACNEGKTGACEAAFYNGYNTSCTAVRTSNPTAASGTYKLAADGSATTRDVVCNMTSAFTAALSGCEASPYVSGDCTAGYNNNYNRNCYQVFSYLGAADGTYHLTTNGAPPTALVTRYCDSNSGCATRAIGAACDDTTIFAGYINNDFYYTTPSDQAGTYTWNNGTISYSLTNVTSLSDGLTNTNTLLTTLAGNTDAPFLAAKTCYDLVYNGLTDWFLPAYNDYYYVLKPNKVAIGNFSDSVYWASGENWGVNSSAMGCNFVAGWDSIYFDGKTAAKKVRCVRKQ